MRLFRRFLTSCLLHEPYRSIEELPVANWIEVHRAGSLAPLIKKKRIMFPGDLNQTWEALYNQFFARFGMTEEFRGHLKKMKQAIVLMADLTQKKDSVAMTRLAILQQEIKTFTSKGEVADFYVSNAALEKWCGFAINPRTTSVAEYYGKIKLMEQAIKGGTA